MTIAREPCAAVVVHHRDPVATERSLRSLLDWAPGLPVVVVDNSTEAGQRFAASSGGGVEVLRVESNDGFGAACNVAFEHLLATRPNLQFALLWNPDCQATPGFLGRLLDTARIHPDAGLVGPRILAGDPPGAVWFECGRVNHWTLSGLHVAAPPLVDVAATDFVSGACCLLDAELLRQGLRFDERYFLYVEDVDLGAQVRARGFRPLIDQRATVIHAEGGSQQDDAAEILGMRRRQLLWITAGKARYAKKWLRPWERLGFSVVAWLLKPLVAVLRGAGVRWLPGYWRALGQRSRMASRPIVNRNPIDSSDADKGFAER